MQKDHQIYSEKLTRRVNELYHDLTEHEYDKKYHKIFESEKKRLQEIWQEHSPKKKGLKILDFGTGTGYVPLTIGEYLSEKDTCYCSDISLKILKIAKKKIEKSHSKKKFKFIKNTGPRLPFKDKALDIIVLSSVLHHLNKPKKYLKEFNRILKPGGILIITHEPNANFYNNKFLSTQFLILNKLFNIGKLPKKIFSSTPIWDPIQITTTQEINKILLKEEVITHPLEIEDVLRIVDIRDRDGFDPNKLMPKYKILSLETYDHLHWVKKNHPGNRLIGWYDELMGKVVPEGGATFSIVLKNLT